MLREREFRAGPYRVGYQSCDDSSTQEGYDTAKCIANPRAYSANERVLGVVGPVHSGCALFEIPIANQAGLAMVSPTNSATWLTHPEPSDTPNILGRLYPTGERNYVRVMPNDRAQGAAHAVLAAELGATSVFVLGDDQRLLYPFHRAAERLGIEIAGESARGSGGGRATPSSPRRSQALAPTWSSWRTTSTACRTGSFSAICARGSARTSRSRQGMARPRRGPSRSPATPRTACSISTHGVPNSELPAPGQAFVAELAPSLPDGEVPSFSAVYGGQSAEVLLDAIARSDGTRASVVQQLFATRVVDGLIGDFQFDANGDPTLQAVTVMRVAPPSEGETIVGLEGAVFDRVIAVPPELLAEEG